MELSLERPSGRPSERASVLRRAGVAFRVQARIVGAVILRDMRTRFGRSHMSFLISLSWPLIHVMIIYFAFVQVAKVVPIGSSAGVFIATGALPYILVLYPGRLLTLAIIQNQQTLMFPIIKTTDLILARVVVEFFSACIVVLMFGAVLTALDVDIVPQGWAEVAAAIFASIYLGLGLGVLNVIVMTLFRLWLVVFIGIMALFWVTAGATTLKLGLSDEARAILSYNPVLHSVIWLRTAYFGDFSEIPLSKSYILGTATVSMFLGLVGDRLLRGRVLMA